MKKTKTVILYPAKKSDIIQDQIDRIKIAIKEERLGENNIDVIQYFNKRIKYHLNRLTEC